VAQEAFESWSLTSKSERAQIAVVSRIGLPLFNVSIIAILSFCAINLSPISRKVAQEAFESWSLTSKSERAQMLRDIGDKLMAQKDKIAMLL
jgi:delta 1-pyrroline-5-carboxylate dehydrogenase